MPTPVRLNHPSVFPFGVSTATTRRAMALSESAICYRKPWQVGQTPQRITDERHKKKTRLHSCCNGGLACPLSSFSGMQHMGHPTKIGVRGECSGDSEPLHQQSSRGNG